MKDPTTRVETIGEGLSAVKEVFLVAYADDNLFAAAAKGAGSVRKYLASGSKVLLAGGLASCRPPPET